MTQSANVKKSNSGLSLTRRRVLQFLSAAVCLPMLPQTRAAQAHQGRRLVLVELAGANDGLNTLVPFSDQRYNELRPNLALKQKELVTLNDDFAFNKSLKDLMPGWEQGELGVIHGLGYPQPNRSHFKSIAIWETGSDGGRQQRHGWMTHAVEHAYATHKVDAHGISFGGGMNVFSSDSGNWLSLNTSRQLLTAFEPSGRSVNPAKDAATEALELVTQRTQQLQESMDGFRQKLTNSKHRARIGNGRLAKQLNHVVNLVYAGVDTPVYKVSLGGFDTHENQAGRHARLLSELGSALAGFRDELKKSGEWENTLVVTYSEFGRRARENLSGGTDHGTAAPHFVMGGAVEGGFYGNSPDLGNLQDDDLQFTMDYRSVYSELLSNWLDISDNKFAKYQDERLAGLLAVAG